MIKKSTTLQAATVISKTTETLVGSAIDCEGATYCTVYLNYTKGDETGLNVVPYFVAPDSSATEFPVIDWASAAGVYTGNAVKVQFTATAKRAVCFDVRGARFLKIYQAGSNNDGTPTGTLAVSYDLKE
jgi:hypothetical protein